jgi:hypothetical protein
MRHLLLPLSLLLSVPAPLLGQSPAAAPVHTPVAGHISLTTALALTSQWDDETHLGNGPLVAVGVAILPHEAFRLEAEVSLARHHRNSGYLEARGTPVVITGRAAWRIGPSRWAVRPFLSAGGTLTHTRGEFIVSSTIPGPDGRPIDGPRETRRWRATEPGIEFGLGAEMRGRGRLWWRPEVRISGTRATPGYDPGFDTIELPILAIRAGLTVIW